MQALKSSWEEKVPAELLTSMPAELPKLNKNVYVKMFLGRAESAVHAPVQLLCNGFTGLIAVLVQLLADLVKVDGHK